jgi:hypothetical protein
MVKLCGFLCLSLLVPVVSAADTLVMWTSEGTITSSVPVPVAEAGRIPNVGTPYQLTLSFNPDQAIHYGGPTAGSNCLSVPVSGTLTLGGSEFSGGGSGFTHGLTPSYLCSATLQETLFRVQLANLPDDNPWPWIGTSSFIEAWYVDLLNPNGFPVSPTAASGLDFQIRDSGFGYTVRGHGNLQGALEQPAPVPEPGTMTLVGLGLLAAVRRARAARRA